MRVLQRIQTSVQRVPLRWRLALISLGLIAFILSAFGLIILFTAEQALFENQATALRNEGRVGNNVVRNHAFAIINHPGLPADLPSGAPSASSAPTGPHPPNFKVWAGLITQKLANTSTNVSVLARDSTVVASSTDFTYAPPTIKIAPDLIRRTTSTQQEPGSYLLERDDQNARQIVVLIPIVDNQQRPVGFLQLSTPTSTIDSFITTLRLILLFGVIGALSIATVVMFPLIDVTLRPLVEMERTSQYIAKGNLSLRLKIPATDDEIGKLARAFNCMIAQLETAFTRQKQFVADVSHELRTPLTALNGSLEMLLIGADKGDREASQRLVRGMYAETQRMQRMVKDLLALTRLDEREIILNKKALNLRTIIDTVYDQAQQLAHGQDIRSRISPDTPLVWADKDRLQQVLLNIIDNALKFTPVEGQVEIVARGEGKSGVIIEVRDTGEGIPGEALPHIFDRFYRADAARSRSKQQISGSGLGLAIAKELIEAQGGTITLSSMYGKGTTVSVRLRADVTLAPVEVAY